MQESAASATIVIIYSKDNNYNKGGADRGGDGNNGVSGCLMSNVVDVGRLYVDPSQWFALQTAMAMMATKTTVLSC
jgi:hypothetical protein